MNNFLASTIDFFNHIKPASIDEQNQYPTIIANTADLTSTYTGASQNTVNDTNPLGNNVYRGLTTSSPKKGFPVVLFPYYPNAATQTQFNFLTLTTLPKIMAVPSTKTLTLLSENSPIITLLKSDQFLNYSLHTATMFDGF